ncbi:hypothetical protein NLG97_g9311 [Lecanicillium saksenae]|uniref:Uncharacterized protein n=1 Tax=Lecanicillium saksenae TaxID=468837 RepID=A0ACC1QHN4_9HYPO|nr:hypothetical protein NLG97_g9311 [Lecanicillium saksenae]
MPSFRSSIHFQPSPSAVSRQPPRAVLTVSTQLLPFKSLLWKSEDEIIAAGYDCEAFRFKGGESGWDLAGTVEAKQMDLKGKVKDDTQLKTIHQNTVTTIRPYESSGGRVTKFTSSGVDGRVVIWNA